MARILGTSIRGKVMGVALAVVLISGAATIVRARLVIAQAVGQQLDERTISIARILALQSQDPVLTGDDYALHELVLGTVRAYRDVRYAFVVGPDGDVLAHTFRDGVPGDLLRLNCDVSRGISLVKLSTEEGIIRDVASPVAAAPASFVKVGVTQRLIDERAASNTKALVVNVSIMCVLALLLAYMVAVLLNKPISDLREAARALGNGDLSARARVWWNDEIGYLARVFNEMADSLQQSCSELQRNEKDKTKLLRKIITSQEEERRRIARELHDETSQSLAAVNVSLGAMANGKSSGQSVEDLRAIISQALERVKNLAYDLRPGLLDDLGLVAAVDRYVEDFPQRYGLPVSFQSIGLDGQRLPSEVETAVYRIVQEALVNSAKHARANHASVMMEIDHGLLRVLIEDDGQGFDIRKMSSDEAGRTLGLFGMQERAILVGGTLEVDSGPGEGTAIVLRIPLRKFQQ